MKKEELKKAVWDNYPSKPVSKTDHIRNVIRMARQGGMIAVSDKMARSLDQSGLIELIESIGGTTADTISQAISECWIEYGDGPSAPIDGDPVAKALENLRKAIGSTASPATPSIDYAEVEKIVLNATNPLKEQIKELEKLRKAVEADKKVASRVAVVASTVAGSDPVLGRILPYYKAGKPASAVCLMSPPSFGKSRSINALGETYDLYLVHGCKQDPDELITLIGSTVPDGKGGFLINDGILTQAVRAASEGKNVLLCLDEILRWGRREMEAMLPFLQPHKGKYRLTTRKVNGDVLEQIECSDSNLHIIGAGNLGPMSPPPAFWSRFIPIRLEWTVDLSIRIGESIAKEFGIADAEALSKQFTKAFGVSRQKLSEMAIEFGIDFRSLVFACRHAENPTRESVCEWLRDHIANRCPQWDQRTGDMIKTSLDASNAIGKELS